MQEKENKSRFSADWFLKAFFAHLIGTVLLSLLWLISFNKMMNSFVHSSAYARQDVGFLEIAIWIWVPIPLLAQKFFGLTIENGLYIFLLVWSIAVGVITGYVAPWLIGVYTKSKKILVDILLSGYRK